MSAATQPERSCRRGIVARAWEPSALPGLAGAALILLALGSAMAQGPDRPTIAVPATVAAEPATQVAFPIRIGPASAIPRNSFVRVRGLPAVAALSEGHSIGPGSWAVPLAALSSLTITLPASAAGRADVVVTLVAADGSVLVEARSVLVVATLPAARPPAQPEPAAQPALLQFPSPVMQPEDRQRALKFMKKGDDELAEGRVAPARLFYERAADMGLAQAAMALAATYDATELNRPHLRAVDPDANEAKRWYERARVLGARDADQRLRRLGAN